MRLALASAVVLLMAGPAHAELTAGPWRAVLASPGGELPFPMELEHDGHRWRGRIHNGPEVVEIPQVRVEGDRVVLDFPHYDAHTRAVLADDGSLTGRYWRQRSRGREAEMAFRAVPGPAWRFAEGESAAGAEAFAGRWRVQFESEEHPSVGEFTATATGVEGTFQNANGDYRFLAGTVVDGELRLSVFDGAHAFLFHARPRPDGTLDGDFWSSNYWHETWSARRDDDAALVDGFQLTRWTDGADLSRLRFPDLEGTPRRLDDPAFAGEARILYIFGSWCPNCADATEYLVELHERFAPRGLSILGLAFEHTGRFDRDARQVRRYAKRHEVPYPLLVAGLSDKPKASEALPILDEVRAYPTTIFLDGEGQVRAIHSGFSGPATGEAHTALRARFEGLLEEMLPAAETGR